MFLHELSVGQCGKVLAVCGEKEIRTRLGDLGVIDGTRITALGKSPLGDPTAYLIRGAVIALRKEDAGNVLVESEG